MFEDKRVVNGVKIKREILEAGLSHGTHISIHVSASSRRIRGQKRSESKAEVQIRIADALEKFIKSERNVVIAAIMPWIINGKEVQLRMYGTYK